MKLIISVFLISLSFGASAYTTEALSSNIKKDAAIEASIELDRGKKKYKTRRQKRINKKRKRKCKQFGRKVYAG